MIPVQMMVGEVFATGLTSLRHPPRHWRLGWMAQMRPSGRQAWTIGPGSDGHDRSSSRPQYTGIAALPQVVVVGDQSSGKLSVLEAVIKFPLPRDSGLCTRFATKITFHRSPQTNVSVSRIPGPSCPPLRADALRRHRRNVLSLDNEIFVQLLEEVG